MGGRRGARPIRLRSLTHEAPGISLGTTGHGHRDQDEEPAHDNYPYQQNVAWLWQRYQTSFHRLAKLALRRVASASRIAQFGRS